jgi:hypothetical protein
VNHWECWRYHRPHACRIWKRHEPQAHVAAAGINGIPGLNAFAWCVASGVGSTDHSTGESDGDFAIDTGNGFLGGYQFEQSTWDSTTKAMGVTWQLTAGNSGVGPITATPAQQTAVFNVLAATDPGAWPNTSPPCLYLR